MRSPGARSLWGSRQCPLPFCPQSASLVRLVVRVARSPMSRRLADRAVKRCLDVAGAVLGLVTLSPVVGATALAVWIVHGRPVLFRQVRPGRNGVSFTLVKFRTMRAPREDEVWYRTDEVRLTPLGRFLR